MPLFRRDFAVDKPVAHATLSICGLGQHAVSINGQAVSASFLDPGWTDYRKTILYSTYDVTAISFAAYAYLRDKYILLDCGASFGEGYGPIVVASHSMKADDLAGRSNPHRDRGVGDHGPHVPCDPVTKFDGHFGIREQADQSDEA